jgi:hypothetical protein
MDQAIKVFFKHETSFFSAFVIIIHQFDTDFIQIEFLDSGMIERFDAADISYIGEKGYKKLPVYQSDFLRPILNSVGNIIENAHYMSTDPDFNDILNEEYIRQN